MRRPSLRRLGFLLLLLALSLWVAINVSSLCVLPSAIPVSLAGEEPGAAESRQLRGADRRLSDVVEWFKSRITDVKTHSTCPQLLSSAAENKIGVPFAMMTAIGELQPPLAEHNLNVSHLLRNIRPLLLEADAVISSLTSPLPSTNTNIGTVLRSLRALGINLVSLASNHIYETDRSEAIMHALEAADVRWLGFNAKHYIIAVIGGVKVGFLAFCGIYGQCEGTSGLPFAPVKYTSTSARSAVGKLRQRGISAIVVLMYWGYENRYFPDETALTIARFLARLDVSVVVGYHPFVVQDHGYLGNTLVLFSLGKVITTNEQTPFCWHKTSDGSWSYSDAFHCRMVHPALRDSAKEAEQQTRVYRVRLSRSGMAVADYTTLLLTSNPDFPKIRMPRAQAEGPGKHIHWTTACGVSDIHCLGCGTF